MFTGRRNISCQHSLLNWKGHGQSRRVGVREFELWILSLGLLGILRDGNRAKEKIHVNFFYTRKCFYNNNNEKIIIIIISIIINIIIAYNLFILHC